ncbi:CYTH domain-containing protein [Roseibacillus persicicus]|uniref:CYTH domain-containing protein n=1 Tax=Roseibacillus persicicus TaxID=454148 RepID=UPI00280E74EC|nr:CYTH domain-containing protein [Roseibacillus persicicus]MDQ8190571.1 CYTH domain-containing protein [Roseibacillus persicicus]
MATEIERKFLVIGEVPGGRSSEMVQGYLSQDPERTIRVRIDDERAYLTIKGKAVGITRAEFEYEVPVADAREMLALAAGFPIRKTRTRVQEGDHLWEVDVFHDLNEGLVVAEVELEFEDEELVLPAWVGEEVTADVRYLNACLSRKPFREWTDDPA